MQIGIMAITALAIAGHMVWYGGGFLPILSQLIQQDRIQAQITFFQWAKNFVVATPVFGMLLYAAGLNAFSLAIPLIHNLFFIGYGISVIIRVVRSNTPSTQSQINKIVFIIAIAQALLVWQVIAALYGITSQLTFPDVIVSLACFAIVVLLQTAIISLLFWLIASTSTTKKLPRYLAGLFAFLCIVIGILNFI